MKVKQLVNKYVAGKKIPLEGFSAGKVCDVCDGQLLLSVRGEDLVCQWPLIYLDRTLMEQGGKDFKNNLGVSPK